jgi:pyridoxine 4-dehydrogenase
MPKDDMRRRFPRFQPENFDKNLDLLARVEKIAAEKKCTSTNVAIAWVKAQSGRKGLPIFIPIPGTTTEKRLVDNMKDVKLSEEEVAALNQAVQECTVHGGRYPAGLAELEWG